MTNKNAQQPTAQLKKQEVQQLLGQFLAQMSKVIADPNTANNAKVQWLNKMVTDLQKQVDAKINEAIGQRTVTVAPNAQKADDANLANMLHRTKDKPLLQKKIQELWAYLSSNIGADRWDDAEPNSVAGVRGAEQVGGIKIAKKDRLKGGKGDNIPYDKLNKEQLEKGIKVEMEHTDDPEVAKEIAGDHLSEQLEEGKEKDEQDYYDELEKIDPHDSAKDSAPAFWRKNLDYSVSKSAHGRASIIWSEFSFVGTTTINIRVVHENSEVSDAKKFSGKEDETRKRAKVYLDQLRQKYPGSRVVYER